LKLARDAANVLAQRNSTTAQAFRVYQSYTDASNYHRWKVDYSGSTCRFGTERAGIGATGNMQLWQNGSTIIEFNSGGKIFFTNREIVFGTWNGGECSLKQSAAYNGRLDLVDASSGSYNNLALNAIFFGGVTSSFARIDSSGTILRARLADDSNFATYQGQLRTHSDYVAGAPSPTGYIVLYDAAGTAYKVPAQAL